MTKIDLVTGFLGAGKTTFIARYGAWLEQQGVRFAVVENEFGAAGVDRVLLSERFGNVRELAGGCICCTLKSGFHAMLGQLCGRCDRVIVEPSGLYNLDDFFEVVDGLARDDLCEPGLCLTLVDPHTLPALTAEERDVLHDELMGTGGVLWTKTDTGAPCDLGQAAASVRACLGDADGAPLLFVEPPAPQLTANDFARLQEMRPVRRAHRRMVRNHREMYQSVSFRPRSTFEAGPLLDMLSHLIETGAYGEILRVKGFVRVTDGCLAVNCTVSDRLAQPCGERPAMVNIIGHALDRAGLQAAFENACTQD